MHVELDEEAKMLDWRRHGEIGEEMKPNSGFQHQMFDWKKGMEG
jgi:hypothetical protein